MLTYTHKANKSFASAVSFVQYVILTSSIHCMCCSLLAMSRAVSPAEFTKGQSEKRKGQMSIYLSTYLSVYPSILPSIPFIVGFVCIIVYLCVKQPLLWVEVSNTQFCCIMYSNEELCFLLQSSFPGSHWENTHTGWSADGHPTGCWQICDTSRFISPVLS